MKPSISSFRPGARRAMTFLEVVFATALFGIVAASILGVFSFTTNAIAREQRLLACSEVANRLIMNYMDDRTAMPDPNKTVPYGPKERKLQFRWEYREEPITLHEPKEDLRDKLRESPLRADRFREVTVRVWLAEDSGGSRTPDESTPQITLSRMYDPMYMRNPDSFLRMVMDPSGQRRFIEELSGTSNALGNAPTGRREDRMGRGSRRSGGIRPDDAFRNSSTRRTRRRIAPRSAQSPHSAPRRAFTLMETMLAAALGSALVLLVVGLMGFIDRAEAAQSRRLEQVDSMSRLQRIMARTFSTLVVADPTSAQAFQNRIDDGVGKKELPPARMWLRADESASLNSALRRAKVAGGGAVQRLEVTLERPPVPRSFARGLTGSLSTSLQANLEEPEDDLIIPGSVRGVFELRPDKATLRVQGTAPVEDDGRLGWTLWWRPIIDERSYDLDPTEDPEAVPIISGLARCTWSGFIKKKHESVLRVVSNLELPAYMELEAQTLGGQYANWMFEVQWSVGLDGTEEKDNAATTGTEGGRVKATPESPEKSR